MAYYKQQLGKRRIGEGDSSTFTYGRTYKDWTSSKTYKDETSNELAETYLHFYDTETQPRIVDYNNLKDFYKLNRSVARSTLEFFSNPEQRIDSIAKPEYNFRALDYNKKLKVPTKGRNYISMIQEANANYDREYNTYNVKYSGPIDKEGKYTEDTTPNLPNKRELTRDEVIRQSQVFNPLLAQNRRADGGNIDAASQEQEVTDTVQFGTS